VSDAALFQIGQVTPSAPSGPASAPVEALKRQALNRLIFVLRRKEPELSRPFRIPGGAPVCALLAIGPAILVVLLTWNSVVEEGWRKQIPTLVAIASGVVVYKLRRNPALS
jgi:hypothetical protein